MYGLQVDPDVRQAALFVVAFFIMVCCVEIMKADLPTFKSPFDSLFDTVVMFMLMSIGIAHVLTNNNNAKYGLFAFRVSLILIAIVKIGREYEKIVLYRIGHLVKNTQGV